MLLNNRDKFLFLFIFFIQDMAKWLAKNGPISIGINANMMQFYFGGISHPYKIFCEPTKLDHGVLIVGYGYDDSSGSEYWKVKNSWGSQWGENGFIRLSRGNNMCGISQSASYPTGVSHVSSATKSPSVKTQLIETFK